MYHRQYRFGSTVIRCEAEQPLLPLRNGKLFEDSGAPDLTLRLKFTDTLPSGASVRQRSWNGKPFAAVCPAQDGLTVWVLPTDYGIGCRTLLTLADLHGLLLLRGAFVLHASYVLTEQGALLFTAPSGTGKSTQAALWSELRGTETVNGDRTLLQRTPAGFRACGCCFCGSSDICRNATAPVRAVICLAQAPETAARRLSGGEAFRAVLPQCAYDVHEPAQVEAISQLLSELLSDKRAFLLACTPDRSAVETLEHALEGTVE